MLKRIAPVLVLMVLSPLVAEYLSGSMSMSQINLLPLMMLLYGAGAVLIRELARRTHHGWTAILFLGAAYGILEEGILCQSLFNPHFHGLRLLDYGFVPSLGIAVPFTVFVLGIHIIWSIAVPIALVEVLFRGRRTEPWLGGVGLAVVIIMFIAGAAMIGAGIMSQEHFLATPTQLGGAALAVLVAAGLAFVFPAERPKAAGGAPSPWIVALIAFLAGSVFVLLYTQGSNVMHWPWQLVEGGMAACAIGMLLFGFAAARRSGWSDMHRFAAAAGALLVYCWFGFLTEKSLYGTTMMGPRAALVVAMLGLLVLAGVRARRASLNLRKTPRA